MERFWNKVKKLEKDECWPWTAAKHPKPYDYGRLGPDRAHRVSYRIHFGEIPKGKFVCHKCDNPPCVNPCHLFLGTNLENVHDAMRKGRLKGRIPGEKHGRAKLTNKQVLRIREEYNEIKSTRKLAKKYGVVRSTIQFIIHRKNWAHI